MAGQTINDRLLAARHSIAGQGLAKSVCKATTEEMIGPKKKHLDYLVHCTNEPNVSIPQLANLLVERSQSTNWVVVYKALITVHHLLAYGNERFTQYLASSNSSFQLSNFLDKSGVQGAVGARIGYDMSPFIRRYAKYLNEKALSYRTVAFDFCKVKRGKEEGSLRTMNAEKLLKTLPVLQAQLDSLLEFDCTANDLTNGVINMCFMLLFRDLIRLFACYNDGIINLLEKYFDMNKKQCRDALDLYKKFLIRMDRVGEFLKVAENVGIDKGDIPDLTKAPSSLLDALEGHLNALEGKKGSAANTPTQTASAQKNVANGMGALSSTGSSFGTAAASTRLDQHPTNGSQASFIDDVLKQQALAEEEAVLNQYKSKVQSPTNSGAMATNPFLSSAPAPANNQQSIVDLFGAPVTQTDSSTNQTSKASDDLLQLGNPFADMFGAPAPLSAAPPVVSSQPPWMNNTTATNGFGANHLNSNNQQTQNNTFVSDTNFSNVFGNATDSTASGAMANPFMGDSALSAMTGSPNRPPSQSKSALDDLNDTIRAAMGGSPSKTPSLSQSQPTATQQFGSPAHQLLQMGFDGLGDVLRPGGQPPGISSVTSSAGGIAGTAPQAAQQQQPGKVLTGDLDSSLASLANNLSINKGAQQNVKGIQWNSPKNSAKPGAAGWSPQPMAATTGAGYRPMGQGMQISPMSHTFHNQHHFNMQQAGVANPAVPGGVGVMGGAAPARPPPPSSTPQQQQPLQLDPFGAL